VALSAGILHIINSPFYGLANKIISIKQAAVLLGFKQVSNIITSQSIKANLGEYINKDLNDFWYVATDVANTSATLVKTLGFGSPDEAYTLGLFLDCDIPILMEKYDDYAQTIQSAYNAASIRITQIENERYSINHAILGYMVSRTWKLPEHLRIVIRDHHNFERLSFKVESSNAEADTMLAVLKMAEHIAHVHAALGKDHEDNEWNKINMYQ